MALTEFTAPVQSGLDRGKRRRRLDDLRQRHEDLREELQAKREEIADDPAFCGDFIKRVDELLKTIKGFAGDIKFTHEYDWVTQATTEWQQAFSSVFEVPRNLRQEVGLAVPSEDLEPSELLYRRDDIRPFLEDRAFQIGQSRKLESLLFRWREFSHHLSRIHQRIASSQEQMDSDWHLAEVCFAAQVVDGSIHFGQQIDRDLYPLLESVWLEEIKRWVAYGIWERDVAGWDPTNSDENYFRACDELRDSVLSGSLEASPASFAEVESYLEEHYLFKGVIDFEHRERAHSLVERKAEGIWKSPHRAGSEKTNWSLAENYVRLFYEHIIPAVTGKKPQEHVTKIVQSLRYFETTNHFGVANAFEICLLAYYVDAGRLREACGQDVWFM